MEITPAISRFDPISDRMGQGHLTDLARKVGLLGCPVRKGTSEAVHGDRSAHFHLGPGANFHRRARGPAALASFAYERGSAQAQSQ